MDRDVVNAIHFMYRHGPLDWSYVWCGPDSKPDIQQLVDHTSSNDTLPDQLMAFLKAVEGQMSNLPKPDFAFGYPPKMHCGLCQPATHTREMNHDSEVMANE